MDITLTSIILKRGLSLLIWCVSLASVKISVLYYDLEVLDLHQWQTFLLAMETCTCWRFLMFCEVEFQTSYSLTKVVHITVWNHVMLMRNYIIFQAFKLVLGLSYCYAIFFSYYSSIILTEPFNIRYQKEWVAWIWLVILSSRDLESEGFGSSLESLFGLAHGEMIYLFGYYFEVIDWLDVWRLWWLI